ncbi:hypothetical protein DICSQDRAFT_99486 [Dichomitus squalens LYAD-421 SS1]|uniref:uncharacterized protein n=1 Tax=Dichomitus squalens (strain LYAD-421) TaxID=732165 RepID=UPI00044154BB|nr:uncharacterized protein DICSQDRAFT_99486 [Dichomitus squalens LYAD-421 SS1]EJF65558.1 hypothetical protein DICSQDRAFT_99486 [Dichomitus squalens LYAD-421 SS1]
MYALKPTSFFRPSSRPTSPVPAPRQEVPVVGDRAARPLSKLSLSTFRKPSPSPVSLPAGAAAPSTVVQDGSFMEVLSLKLSEAVSRALAQPTGPAAPGELLAGRRPIPSGRGRALGALIVSEINASRENPHVYRAVIRTLQRPLSVLSTNLSSNLVSLISSPAFGSPAAPTPQNPELNATQLHAVSLATFAGELLESFDEIGLGFEVDTRGESLRSIREGLVSIVKRVVDPLIAGIKHELLPILDALETAPSPPVGPTSSAGKSSGGIKSPVPHPAIMTLQATIPIHARALSRIVASAYAENALASLVISLIWRGMVALAHRPTLLPSPPSSPSMGTIALLKSKDSKKTLGGQTPASPPATPPASRFTLKLPPSRPPSPPSVISRGPTVAADARTLYNLLNQLPKPSLSKEQTRLAREVVDEAFDGLSAFIALLESIQVHTPPVRSSSGTGSANTSPKVTPLADLEADLDLLTADIPIVIALPLLLRTYLPGERSVPAILGLGEVEYRKNCLSGFGRAEECGVAVGQRVLDVLRAQGSGGADAEPLLKWLERELKTARAERDEGDVVMHGH